MEKKKNINTKKTLVRKYDNVYINKFLKKFSLYLDFDELHPPIGG